MGRTLPSAADYLKQQESQFAKFRGALRRADQLALNDLFNWAHLYVAAVQYASHPLPFEVYLLAMLLEQHKQVIYLKAQLDALLAEPTNLDERG